MCNIKTQVNNKGITIVETMIALLVTAVAIVSLMPMQDTSLRAGFRADYLGRAAYIMQAELEDQEYQIMNPEIPVAVGTSSKIVTTSGSASPELGSASFNVQTTITAVTLTSWLVNVRVTWTNGPANGITSSIIATRHYNF